MRKESNLDQIRPLEEYLRRWIHSWSPVSEWLIQPYVKSLEEKVEKIELENKNLAAENERVKALLSKVRQKFEALFGDLNDATE